MRIIICYYVLFDMHCYLICIISFYCATRAPVAPRGGAVLAAVQMPQVQPAGTSGRRDLTTTIITITTMAAGKGGIQKEKIQQ